MSSYSDSNLTSANDALIVEIGSGDDSNNKVIVTTDGNLQTVETCNGVAIYSNVIISTVPTALRVGATNLTNRKFIMIEPIDSDIYVGYSVGLTSSNGMLYFKNQQIVLPIGSNITVYAITVSGTKNVRISEFS